MLEMLTSGFWILFRANVLLLASAALVAVVLSCTRLRSPQLHRWAWGCVLLQGMMLTPLVVELPWLAPSSEPVVLSAEVTAGDLLSMDGIRPSRPGPSETLLSPPAKVSRSWMTGTFWGTLFLAAGWAIGMGICVWRAWVRYQRTLGGVAESAAAPDAWQQQWQDVLDEREISAPIPLRVHSHWGPLLCRTRSEYVVVVPRPLWERCTESQRIAILRHERAHYLRGDVWWTLAAWGVALLHWFNPIAWLAVRRWGEAAEWCCDEDVARARPDQAPTYAATLLQLGGGSSPELGVTAAGGSGLAQRIRRLVARPQRDAWTSRGLLMVLLATLVTVGTVRWELVERPLQAQEPTVSVANEKQLADQLTELAAALDPGSDPLVQQLQAALRTEEGQLVARDEVGWIEQRLRNEARDRALPNYLEAYFSAEGGIKDEEFANTLVQQTKQYQQDIQRIASELARSAKSVPDDSEQHKLLKRFMLHEASASILYFRELRRLLRPDAMAIAERLDEAFVRVGNTYQIRAGGRDEVEEFASRATRALACYQALREDVDDFARELADRPELTKRLKDALQGSALIGMAAFEMSEDPNVSLSSRGDEMFEQLEWVTVDAAEGLVVRKEAREEVEERLQEVQRIEATAKRIRGAVAQFAEQVVSKDPLHEQLKAFLASELALVVIGSDYELSSASPEEIVQVRLSEALEKSDDGTVRIREEQRGEFVEHVQEIMREYRTLMRKAKPLHRFAERVANEELREALQSTAGKFVIAASIQREFAGKSYGGFRRWREENFESTGGRYRVREELRERIPDFLERVREVEEELEHDDF